MSSYGLFMRLAAFGMHADDDADGHDDATTGAGGGEAAVRKCWAGPDAVSYNSVLFCLTRALSGRGTVAREAEALLRRMKERHVRSNDDDVRPDKVMYGAVLHSLVQAGMAREAESILESLEDDEGGDEQ